MREIQKDYISIDANILRGYYYFMLHILLGAPLDSQIQRCKQEFPKALLLVSCRE